MIGGTCINVACIPTKTIINSGRVLGTIRRAAEFGIAGAADPRMDLELLRRRKEDVVGTMVKGQLSSFTGSGMDFILGEAKFVGPRTVEVALNDGGRRSLRGDRRRPQPRYGAARCRRRKASQSPPCRPATRCWHSVAAGSIIILGGGYVGCEFADLLNTIGVKVTVVQSGGQLLAREDPEVAGGSPTELHRRGHHAAAAIQGPESRTAPRTARSPSPSTPGIPSVPRTSWWPSAAAP